MEARPPVTLACLYKFAFWSCAGATVEHIQLTTEEMNPERLLQRPTNQMQLDINIQYVIH